MSGIVIAGIVIGVLVIIALVIALFSRRSPPPSHYFDDEKLSNDRPYNPFAPPESSDDMPNYKGNFLLLLFLFLGVSSELSQFCCASTKTFITNCQVFLIFEF